MLSFIFHAFIFGLLEVSFYIVKFLFSSDNKTKPLEDKLQLNFGKPLLEQYYYQNVSWLLSECFLKLCAQMQHNVLTLTFS